MSKFAKVPACNIEPGDVIAKTKSGDRADTVTRVERNAGSVWLYFGHYRIRPRLDTLVWALQPGEDDPADVAFADQLDAAARAMFHERRAGTACSGRPWTLAGWENAAETWGGLWNALAERRSDAAAAAAERERCGVAGGSFATVDGQGSFGALGGGGTGRPALVDETGRRWGYFPAGAAYSAWSGYDWQNRSGIGIRSGWYRERTRRQEAAATAGGAGWQMVDGITAGRLMAAGKPLDRSDDDSTVCVTPAGKAALAGFVGLDLMRDHGWTWDLDLQARPGETRRDQMRRGSEDEVRERQSWQAPVPAPALTADDLHDLARCRCVRCAGERRAARAHAEAAAGALGYHRSMVERARKIRDDRGEV